MTDEAETNTKYAVIAAPKNGLRFDGGKFVDGRGNLVAFSGQLDIYQTESMAVAAKRKLRAAWPAWKGEFVMVRVDVHEISEEVQP